MKLSTFVQRIPGYYKTGTSIYLKSGPGWGKSDGMRLIPSRLKETFGGRYGLQILMGPSLIPGDTMGYMLPAAVDELNRPTSLFTMPYWWYVRDEDGVLRPLEHFDGGVIVIDEFDKASGDDKKLWGEGMLSGRVGAHQLPPGWLVWAAGNRSKDKSGSNREYLHLVNRQLIKELSMDVDGWVQWAFANGVDAPFIRFAEENSNIVWSDEPPSDGPFCTPRSLVRLNRTLDGFRGSTGELPIDDDALDDARGTIGDAATAQLFAQIRLNNQMPRYSDIIADPAGCVVPKTSDTQMLVCYTLASRVSKDDVAPVVQYVERMPKEFTVVFAKAACRRDTSLVSTATFGKWAMKNAQLMQIIENFR